MARNISQKEEENTLLVKEVNNFSLDNFQKTIIDNFSIRELEEVFLSLNEKRFRALQVYRWLFQRGAKVFQEMTDLSKNLRSKLADNFSITHLGIKELAESKADGSIKILFELFDKNCIEAVILKDGERLTGCISSQVGCKMGCTFCNTAKIGFVRNLSCGEIIRQIIELNEISIKKFGKKITNIVFMGMGEPLDNIDNVIKALNIIHDDNALGYSHRKVTISTSGVSKNLFRLFELSKTPNIAISLNATTNEVRNKLMPINNKYPIEILINDIKNIPLQKRKRVTFEYVLIRGVNDSISDAKRLIKLIRGIPSKINLIVYNSTKGSVYSKPDYDKVLNFQKVLTDANLTAFIRKSFAEDIEGACGQLYAKYIS
jgi:23S rRNA (adenine2503-C2)-methyltransferase